MPNGWLLRPREKLLIMMIAVVLQNHEIQCKQKLASWRGPTSFILGQPPVERDCSGLAFAFGRIFVFGGNAGSAGTRCFRGFVCTQFFL